MMLSVFFQNILAGAIGGLLAVILIVSLLFVFLHFAGKEMDAELEQ